MKYREKIKEKLKYLYGNNKGTKTYTRLTNLMESYKTLIPAGKLTLSQKDAVLITYGDSFIENNEKP